MSAPKLALSDTSNVTTEASDDVTHPPGLQWGRSSIGPIWGVDDDHKLRLRKKIDGLFGEKAELSAETSPWLQIANKLIGIWVDGFRIFTTLILFILLPLFDCLLYLPTQNYRYRRLEVVCRYGDYLAERLDILRDYVADNKLENKNLLARNWTEISAALDEESAQRERPCYDLIKAAAEGLGWDGDLTIFMAREYGTRNSLVHNSLPSLIEIHDWKALHKRCEEDQAILRRLFFIDIATPDKKPDRDNWADVINSFRERFIQSKDNSELQLNPIIDEGLRAGLRDWKSLNKLADVPKHLPAKDREMQIQRLKGDRNKTEAKHRLLAKLESDPELNDVTKKLADKELEASNLEKRVKELETAQNSRFSRSQNAIDQLKTNAAIVQGMNEKLQRPETQTKVRDCGLLEILEDLELLKGLLELGININTGELELEANSDDEALAMRGFLD